MFSKETPCSPNGLDCYSNMSQYSTMCSPCKGLYADIAVDTSDRRKVKEMKRFNELIKNYENYTKRADHKNIEFTYGFEGIILKIYKA